MSTPQIAVIGCGYWGKNLVRVFHQLGSLVSVCDVRTNALEEVSRTYGVDVTCNLQDVLNNKAISGIVIAAPAAQHYEIAKHALTKDKDVYVEKPLALTLNEGRDLIEIATRNRRILMVGHILEYHPAIGALRKLVREGELGRIQYIYSSRLNLGKLRTEENILWSFAPHDISVVLSLLDEMPESVSAQGGSFLNPRIADTTLTTCRFRSGVMAHIFVSWLHPFKEQRLCVVGERSMAVFDDVEAENKLVLYRHRVDWVNRLPTVTKKDGEVIPLPQLEPLREECQHFLDCIRDRRTPLTDGTSGLRVLEVLDASERSLRAQGQTMSIDTEAKRYFAHATAVIDSPCDIGAGTKIWHFSHVMANARIGEHCNLGQNVVVSPGCTLGNRVKVQNNVSIYTGVEIEDDVFCGPSAVFTNVINPRSHIVRKNEYRRTLIKRGASLGANCTIVCGVTVGEYAFVAAGAVVSKSVPAYALVMGAPARQAGWMCYCGIRLLEVKSPVCTACGRRYVITDGSCKPLHNDTRESYSAMAECAD
ncbi:MAG: Gfo/Idh/MocA family oxidoreductase [Terriglobales bacterium]